MHIDPVEHEALISDEKQRRLELVEASHTELFAQFSHALEQGLVDFIVEAPMFLGERRGLADLVAEYLEDKHEAAFEFCGRVIGHAIGQVNNLPPINVLIGEAIGTALAVNGSEPLIRCAIKCCRLLLASPDAVVRLEVMAVLAAFARLHADTHCDAAGEGDL